MTRKKKAAIRAKAAQKAHSQPGGKRSSLSTSGDSVKFAIGHQRPQSLFATSQPDSFQAFLKQPPTGRELKHRSEVVSALCSFWDNIKFKEGWTTPTFSLEDAKPAFRHAANIVSRVRAYLDMLDPSLKLRLVDGNAQDLLWGINDAHSFTNYSRDKFVKDLVHAILQDANGYVEGLSAQDVDNFIKSASALSDEHAVHLGQVWESTFLRVSELVHRLPHDPSENKANIEKLCKSIESLDDVAQSIYRTLPDERPFSSPSSRHSPVTPRSTSDPTLSKQEENREPETTSSQNVESEPAASQKEDQNEEEQENVSTGTQKKTKLSTQEESESQKKSQQEEANSGETTESPEEEKKKKDLLQKLDQVRADVEKVEKKIDAIEADMRNYQISDESSKTVADHLTHVSTQQTKLIGYSEQLMRFLFRLDEIVGHPAVRPVRKELVSRIQRKISSVDTVHDVIKPLLNDLRQKDRQIKAQNREQEEKLRREQEAEAEAERHRQELLREEERKQAELRVKKERERIRREKLLKKQKEAAEAQRKQEEAEANEKARKQQSESESDSDSSSVQTSASDSKQEGDKALVPQQENMKNQWRSLRLRPKMDAEELLDSYVVTANIPGMNKEDIDLHLTDYDNSLVIGGCRLPSAQEERLLRSHLEAFVRRNPELANEDETVLLLKSGFGRFGTFKQIFELPQNADRSRISASYERGVLRVVIPKRRRPTAQPQYRAPQYAQTPQGYYGYPFGSPSTGRSDPRLGSLFDQFF